MNYLSRYDKSLLLPKIVYSPMDQVGGQYYRPGRYEIEKDGRYHDARRGIIIISTRYPELIPGSIAHEWRHHWQIFNIGPHPNWPWQFENGKDDYQESIRKYFRMWHEFDAFRFEYHFARNWSNENWREIIGGTAIQIRPSR